ncbi:MAG: cation transporter [Alphaproteobacteria bacterium]|nr:cation transporter [Alphaproteobacteria bacterium]MBU6474253.1 cation transporter [Alphaproteobacteria bacterium]
MNYRLITVAAFAVMLSPLATQAAERTVTLDVRNANCELCAPIVKKSLARVPGVKAVAVKQTDQMADPVATVTFDDAVTNISALIAATTNAGYPSHLVQSVKR